MELKDVVKRGVETQPVKLCIYGNHGVGKTTFASTAPGSVLLLTEDGAGLIDAAKFPLCKTFQEFVDYLVLLVNEKHDYKSLVIDSLDWLEVLIHAHVCKARGKMALADFDFGRGYSYALDEFMRVIKACDILRNDKGMNIIFTAHSKSEEFKCPLNGVYNRYSLDTHKNISAKISHWCDLIGFLHFATRVVSDEGKFGSEFRRVVGDKRVIGFEDTPAYDAKRRIKIPGKIEVTTEQSYNQFWESVCIKQS